jgi:hypothetical protein
VNQSIEITLKLTLQDVEGLLSGVNLLPHGVARPLYDKVASQAQAALVAAHGVPPADPA